MKINEIFYSIQGEGQWTGLPNIFIRTQGCNLRCSYCDTKYAYENGREITINKIMKEISKYPCKNVCITGGEPLLQPETEKLIESLSKKKYNILIETNGSIPIDSIKNKKNLMISMDIKCPSSKMSENNNFNNIKKLKIKDQIKFVIQNKKDYEYAKKTMMKYKPKSLIFFQPVWGFNPRVLANWIIKDGLNVKLGLQIHKIIWGDKEGV
jgi:7-carboxy-7-deazaguanine synthase